MTSLIKSGYLDKFVFFEAFSSKRADKNEKEFKKFEKKIKKSKIIISIETKEDEKNVLSFTEEFYQELLNRKKIFRELIEENRVLTSNLQNDIKRVKQNSEVHFSQSIDYTKINIIDDLEDKLLITQEQAIQQIISMYDLEQQHTGVPLKSVKKKFLLMPVKIINSGVSSYINVFMTIFKHGYAHLQFSYQIENKEMDEINLSVWNLPLEKVLFPEIMVNGSDSLRYIKKAKCNTLTDVIDCYLQYLNNFMGINLDQKTNFSHLTLLNFAHRPKDFYKKVNTNLSSDIYKLLYSPINEFTIQSDDLIENTLISRYYDFSKFYRVYANHNRIISLYSERIDLPFKTIHEEPLTHVGFYFSGLGGLLNSIELIMLKKFSNEKYSLNKVNKDMSLKDLINVKIKENMDYFQEFSQYYFNYASIRSFNRFLEKSCEDYLETNLMIEQRRKIEELITLNKEKNIYNFTALSALFAILLTLIFSLPTLEQFFKILNINKNYLFKTYLIINLVYAGFILNLYKRRILVNFKNALFNIRGFKKKK